MATSSCARQRSRRERLRESGARELLVTLYPDSLKALERLCQGGASISEAISQALIQAVAGPAKRESEKALRARRKAEVDLEKAKARTEEAKAATYAKLIELQDRGIVINDLFCDVDGVYKKH